MIKKSFVILEKVSRKKEQSIWQQGIREWSDFLRAKQVKGISREKKWHYDRQLWDALKKLQEEDSAYFVSQLPAKEMWRLYEYFNERCCFLDVETDSSGRITVVGISDYFSTQQFVFGVNLEKNLLEAELRKYKILVTFNGASFDLPKLKKQFGMEIGIPHIDLKPLCVKLGLVGGLKEVEKVLNLKRPAHLVGNPVDLWKAFHASGDREYLELLLEYNREDIENLKAVMEWCYKDMKNKTITLLSKDLSVQKQELS
ncbi:ribonuclease H-like domain-containing protein [Candidatus Woesearchaeota archaeon]|nr:ribonuclease H-like domain-containing protein [Candidatus Woesearchaeota archaeon]